MQRPRRVLGVSEELLVNQRSAAKGMPHERKERRAEKEERTGGGKKESREGGRNEERQVTGGLRATTKTRAFPAGEMVLN